MFRLQGSSCSFAWPERTQVNWIDALRTLPRLGLQLTPTPFLLNEVEQILLHRGYNNGFNGDQGNSSGNAYAMTIASKDKLKADSFTISSLKIGLWERVSRHEDDLVAKCYFAKRKLVWEFLENSLKSKIGIQWFDILSLKGFCFEGQPGILEIELTQPPAFFHEIDPKPRKHTQWRMVSDFTGGQAPTYRFLLFKLYSKSCRDNFQLSYDPEILRHFMLDYPLEYQEDASKKQIL